MFPVVAHSTAAPFGFMILPGDGAGSRHTNAALLDPTQVATALWADAAVRSDAVAGRMWSILCRSVYQKKVKEDPSNIHLLIRLRKAHTLSVRYNAKLKEATPKFDGKEWLKMGRAAIAAYEMKGAGTCVLLFVCWTLAEERCCI